MKAKEKLNKLEGKSFAKTVSFISDRNHLFKQQLCASKIYKEEGIAFSLLVKATEEQYILVLSR